MLTEPLALDLSAAEGEPTELALQVGRVMRRAADSLLRPEDWPWAALVVLGLPGIDRALADARTLAEVRERHQPVRWSEKHRGAIGAEDSEVVACSCGRGAHPCPDAVALGWPW